MKTFLLSGIRKSVEPEKEALIVEEDLAFIVEIETSKLKMLFQRAGHRYVQVDLTKIVDQISQKLAPHINIETFLRELILLHSAPAEVMELKERLLEKGYVVPVSEASKCYSLMIGGKRGRPYEFNLVG